MVESKRRFIAPLISIMLCLLLVRPVFAAPEALLVWPGADQQGMLGIYLSSLENGQWTARSKVSASTSSTVTPAVAIDNENNIWIVWTVLSHSSSELFYVVGNNSKYRQPKKITTDSQYNTAPAIMVSKTGEIYLAWAGNNEDMDDIYFSQWRDNGWSRPTRANSTNNVPDILPRLTQDANGNVRVAWSQFTSEGYIEAATTLTQSALWQTAHKKDQLEQHTIISESPETARTQAIYMQTVSDALLSKIETLPQGIMQRTTRSAIVVMDGGIQHSFPVKLNAGQLSRVDN